MLIIGFAFVGCKQKQDKSDHLMPQSADQEFKETKNHMHL